MAGARSVSRRQPLDSVYDVKARILRLLANPKRLEIVDLLRDGERTVTEIAKAVGLTQAGTSQHLSVLRRGGVLAVRKDGNHVHYRLADPTIGSACLLMNDAIAAVLAREQEWVRPALRAVRSER